LAIMMAAPITSAGPLSSLGLPGVFFGLFCELERELFVVLLCFGRRRERRDQRNLSAGNKDHRKKGQIRHGWIIHNENELSAFHAIPSLGRAPLKTQTTIVSCLFD
jgi:hypothetical protein